MDGLWAALNLLEADYQVERQNLQGEVEFTDGGYDFVLGWGSFGSKVDQWLQYCRLGVLSKFGLCIAGNANPPTGATNYDVLFFETKWYRDQINFHPNIHHAFGVNTDIFFPADDYPYPVLWDYIGVGAFAAWKRWDRMVAKPGRKLVAGYVQDDNLTESLGIVQQLLKHNVMVSNQVNPFDLALLYHCSRTAYIPADLIGGGERSVLEARACGLTVEVEDDNPKLKELVDGPILSHHDYAKMLDRGIRSVL